jgi:hypothetical protein
MDDAAIRAQRVLEIARLRDEITELAGHLNAANYRFLKLIAEFDRREGWVDNATQSCAHWLNWKCGIAMGAACEKVRVARAAENLPKIAAAMERGEVSYSKVREITRVACAGTEDYLLMISRHGTADHVHSPCTLRLPPNPSTDSPELGRAVESHESERAVISANNLVPLEFGVAGSCGVPRFTWLAQRAEQAVLPERGRTRLSNKVR